MDLEGLPNVAKVGLVGGIVVMFAIGAVAIISWLFQYVGVQNLIFNYWNFASHLPSLISAVISLGVLPSTFTPNATHVPMMVFATDFSEEA